MSLYLGIDVGTSGVRAAVVDAQGNAVSAGSAVLPQPALEKGRPIQNPQEWWHSLEACINSLASNLAERGRSLAEVRALSVDGTSGTVLLADSRLRPVAPALMYNSSGFPEESEVIDAAAPENAIVRGTSSALARLLHLQTKPEARNASHAMHQADWIAAQFTGVGGFSDENNALKTGYDPLTGGWPCRWLTEAGLRMELLPDVKAAGVPIGTVQDSVRTQFGFSKDTVVAAGTTDSIAGFVASGASQIGDGVTSIGTTLAIKLLSNVQVTDVGQGVYSHRIWGKWLAGGASNSGGGALLKHFSVERIKELSERINPEIDSGLRYYPLPRPGERFPVSDPDLQPKELPRPESDSLFLAGLFEGLARIERSGFASLADLGAPAVRSVRTVGGAAGNRALRLIRQRILGCPVSSVPSDSAVGSALLALRSSVSSEAML